MAECALIRDFSWRATIIACIKSVSKEALDHLVTVADIAVFEIKIGASFYLSTTLQALTFNDLMHGLCKTPFFGLEIALIGCYNGLSAAGGADGVGRSTTVAAVLSSITVLITDFFLTKLFIALPIG